MSRKGSRQTVFVCATISVNNELLIRIIPAETPKIASDLFSQEVSLPPKEVLGPFYKKKTQIIENTRTLKFTNQTKKAIYNDWMVDAFLLQEPKDQAYLVFIKRVDNKNIPFPKGTITVPISDLRFLHAEKEFPE
jgi:hypothetical protein